MATTFTDILPVQQIESHKYAVTFTDPWCIGTVPNGGYVTSSFMTVASKHMQTVHPKRNQKHVINLHLEFMRRTAIGEAIFIVSDVKLGSRISNLHLTVAQKDPRTDRFVDEVMGYITMSNIDDEDGMTLETGSRIHPEPLPVSLEALSRNEDVNYARRGRDPVGDFRKAARNMAMHLVRPNKRPSHFPKALIDQWVKFQPEGQNGRHTNDSLGFVVDIFPQIIEGYVNPDLEYAAMTQDLTPEEARALVKSKKRKGYWYPTLSLNLDVRKALPEAGVEWLFVRLEATKVYHGRFDLQIRVLDETGDLVAQSTHANLAVDSTRNTTRSKVQQSKM